MNFDSVDIAILTLGTIAIFNMAARFDSLIVQACIAGITTVLSIHKYLKREKKESYPVTTE